MTLASAPAALLGDVVWCLGLGCMLGAGRGFLSFAVGDGPLRRFVCDLLTFVVAAFLLTGLSATASAGGLARWYMAGAMAAGAGCWQYSVQYALARFVRALLALCILPWRLLKKNVLLPFQIRIVAKNAAAKQYRQEKKTQKEQKKVKKQLPNQSKVYYN